MVVSAALVCYNGKKEKAGLSMKKFFQVVPLKHVLFVLALFAVTLLISFAESANLMKIEFGEETVSITSKKYSMSIDYVDVASIELAEIQDAGESIDGRDNISSRGGQWKNDAWGEYTICANLAVTKCILVRLEDGRLFVFNSNSDEKTQAVYEEFLNYLSQ